MKTEAEMILAEARRKIASLKKDSFFRLTLDADIDSICFLADRTDLSKGINSSQNINKAFKKYPEEITSILLKANSLLFAPGFAGGDIGKACNMFLSLMRDHSSDMSNWDLASLYSGIGIACYKLKDYPNAKAYLSNAKSMYPVDSEIDSYLEKQERS